MLYRYNSILGRVCTCPDCRGYDAPDLIKRGLGPDTISLGEPQYDREFDQRTLVYMDADITPYGVGPLYIVSFHYLGR